MGWGSIFGSGPNTEVPKAGRDWWLSSMSAINGLLGDEGPFGKAGVARQKADFANQAWNTYNGDGTRFISDAERGITPSGANFGRIQTQHDINANDVNVTQNALLAKLQGMFQANSAALGGISGGSFGGQPGILGPLLQAGATYLGTKGK